MPTDLIRMGNATRRFADPACLPGTTVWHDQVVPPVRFFAARGGDVVRPTDFRHDRALVLAFVHDRCRDCTSWVQEAIDAICDRPDAAIRVVAPRTGPPGTGDVLWLDRQDVRGRLVVDPAVPAVLVLDRYGAVQEASIADGHALPGPDELIATVDHLAMQCPECSV